MTQNPEEISRRFLKFVEGLRRKLYGTAERTMVSAAPDTDGLYATTDLKDPAVTDPLMFEAWEQQADYWLGIESEQTYAFTMRILAERCIEAFNKISSRNISNRPIRVLSLGCGPGVYEIFFAWWLKEYGFKPQIVCLDYSPAMIDCLKKILRFNERIGGPVRPAQLQQMIQMAVGDMSDLSAFHHTDTSPGFDIVWINNSLQWCRNWQEVLRQASLTFKPKGLGQFFLVVHDHAMTLRIQDRGKVEMPLVRPEDVMDRLEANGFTMKNMSIIRGKPGTGQNGAALSRSFITGHHTPGIKIPPWREATQSTGARFFTLG